MYRSDGRFLRKMEICNHLRRQRLESFTRDPIGYEGSEWNLYEYCKGCAFTKVDPSGTNPLITIVAGSIGCYACGLWLISESTMSSDACRCPGNGPRVPGPNDRCRPCFDRLITRDFFLLTLAQRLSMICACSSCSNLTFRVTHGALKVEIFH